MIYPLAHNSIHLYWIVKIQAWSNKFTYQWNIPFDIWVPSKGYFAFVFDAPFPVDSIRFVAV